MERIRRKKDGFPLSDGRVFQPGIYIIMARRTTKAYKAALKETARLIEAEDPDCDWRKSVKKISCDFEAGFHKAAKGFFGPELKVLSSTFSFSFFVVVVEDSRRS